MINKNYIKSIMPGFLYRPLRFITYYTLSYGWKDQINYLFNRAQNLQSQRVSVVIPSYKSEHYIKDAVRSVLNQTYTNYEILIMTDISENGIKSSLKEYKDRIKFFFEPNLHAADKFNQLVKLAQGDLIVFLCE